MTSPRSSWNSHIVMSANIFETKMTFTLTKHWFACLLSAQVFHQERQIIWKVYAMSKKNAILRFTPKFVCKYRFKVGIAELSEIYMKSQYYSQTIVVIVYISYNDSNLSRRKGNVVFIYFILLLAVEGLERLAKFIRLITLTKRGNEFQFCRVMQIASCSSEKKDISTKL